MVINILIDKKVELGIIDPSSSFLWVSIKGGWLSQLQFLWFGWCSGSCGGCHCRGTGLLMTHEERISGSWNWTKWCQGFELKK